MQFRPMEAGRQSKGRLWSTLGQVCELLHVTAPVPSDAQEPLFQHVQFAAGERVYRVGTSFDTLYVVNSGFLKTLQFDESGNEQVLSFPTRGDLIGVDGIHGGYCVSEAVALSECDLVLLPFRKVAALGRAHPEVEDLLCSLLSRELGRRQAVMGMLCALSAEARVARFLVSLAERFREMGYSGKTFNLRMTRQEMGSYLGLTLETVSRTLSAFNEMGLIAIHQRAVTIHDPDALRSMRRLPPSRSRPRSAGARPPARPGDGPGGPAGGRD